MRRKALQNTRHREKGLTGAQLDTAVLALAAADPSLVKFEHAGGQ